MKLLLAEDDVVVRDELRELLTDEGYDVVTAKDGIEAFELFRDNLDIELLILDIRMPRCTGLQTLDAIRKIDIQSDRIFEAIFITGNNDSDSIIAALKLEAYSFLFKPVVVEHLLKELAEAKDSINLRRYRRMQEQTRMEASLSGSVQLPEGLQNDLGSMVELLAVSAEQDNPDIRLHLQRISEMAVCLAGRLNLDPDQVKTLRYASMLHDIGKLNGPSEVYASGEALSQEDIEGMRCHTTLGGELLAHYSSPLFLMARTIAEQHHENWDGSGYPNGLRGHDIALEAAIVHVIDVYDNLRAPRPYKKGLSHNIALDMIINGDERTIPDHFNPQVLQALLAKHRDIESIYGCYAPPPPAES